MRTLNLYNWKLNDIEEQLNFIQEQGFNCILISTIQPLYVENALDWWNSCVTRNYGIGNYFGNINDLISLCQKAKILGIKIMIDIIPIIKSQMDDTTLSSTNYRLLGLNCQELIRVEEEEEFMNLCLSLIKAGIESFCFPYTQLQLFYDQNNFVEKLFHICQMNHISLYIFCRNSIPDIGKNYKYFEIITSFQSAAIPSAVKYIESPYSYYDYNFGITRSFTSSQISNKYKELCEKYENTLYFARPFDDEWKSSSVKEANQILYRACKQYTKIY